jgi:hypothetical protein
MEDREKVQELLANAYRVARHITETEIPNPIYWAGCCYNPTYYKLVDRRTGLEEMPAKF